MATIKIGKLYIKNTTNPIALNKLVKSCIYHPRYHRGKRTLEYKWIGTFIEEDTPFVVLAVDLNISEVCLYFKVKILYKDMIAWIYCNNSFASDTEPTTNTIIEVEV